MVKVSNKVLLAGGLATAIGISGCKKYEDGPMFSLLTKKQRLTGEWEATKLISDNDGQNMINQGMEVEMEFDGDGDFKLKSTYDYTYTYIVWLRTSVRSCICSKWPRAGAEVRKLEMQMKM